MTKSPELIISVLDYLNTKVNYAVLRNYEELPYGNSSRDIDIIIEKKELDSHKETILKIITDAGWKIVTYLNNGRLISYVCGIIVDDNVELIQWDFFLHSSMRGVTFADAKEFLEGREFNGTLYHVSKDFEFLDKYLYNRAVGVSYPAKYNSIREQVEGSDIVKKKLKAIYGYDNVNTIDKVSGKKLLIKALMNNLKADAFRTIYRLCSTQFTMWRNFLLSSTAPQIGFTGPDGSGKTTVIELIHENIYPVFGTASEFFHFRPTLFGNLGETAHFMGVKKEVDRNYNIPHRGTKTGVLNSFIRLCYYTIDYTFGFWIKVKPHCCRTKFVIFDRYYTDIIADSHRSRIYLNTKLLYYWGKLFIPSLNYNILLTTDADTILARKQELDRGGIDRINSKLDYLKNKKGYYLVLNSGKPEETVRQILTIIFDEQNRRNLKRLNICITPKND